MSTNTLDNTGGNKGFELQIEDSTTLSSSLSQSLAKIKTVKDRQGNVKNFDFAKISQAIREACKGYEKIVSAELLVSETLKNLYDGMPEVKVIEAAIMSSRSFIEKDPAFSFVSARLLLQSLYEEVVGRIVTHADRPQMYREALKIYLDTGIAAGRLDKRLKSDFDLERIASAILPTGDDQFTFLGLQTLYDRYFIHVDNRRIELPQLLWMRVAMGLALVEKSIDDRTTWAIKFYNKLQSFDYCSSTPTLFNSGTPYPQLSSCFLTTIPDDLGAIYKGIRDNALLSKFSGGLGNDWTPVRGLGSHIKGTNGVSQGTIPFLKVANDTAVAVNQGGKRKGAVCSYLETWHIDIEEYLEMRKNTGDDRRRTHDMNTANWVPDMFMKRVEARGEWTLFSPNEAPDLHDLTGEEFEKAYLAYEQKGREGKLKNFKVIQAVDLWRKMLTMLFETGHPWITFKDPCNVRSPQSHVGVVHSSNLCTEITLNTSSNETAVCNLGSINLVAHINEKGEFDTVKLRETVFTAMRMLDNVIDQNLYPIPEAQHSNVKHRPVGLGLMGFQDALHKMKVPYDSTQAVDFADHSMEQISYFAILASSELAKERGAYETFAGSLWDRGILPVDSIRLLDQARGQSVDMDRSVKLDWTPVRESIKKYGMRNSNTMAIAPTATISNIIGVSQSIEPTYKNLFVKSNMSGEFTIINPYLVEELKSLGLWDAAMIQDLKRFDGELEPLTRVPPAIVARYKTAFNVDHKWLIEAASRRQKWIDQAQSLNLYMAAPSGKKLAEMYLMAWKKGLKTTYYLRCLGATTAEKSTITTNDLRSVSSMSPVRAEARSSFQPEFAQEKTSENAPATSQSTDAKFCSITDPTCEACQ